MAKETLFDYLNRKRPNHKWKQTATFVNGKCIVPGHNDSSPSFGVSLSSGMGKCYSCGRFDFLEVVQMLEGGSKLQAIQAAKNIELIQADVRRKDLPGQDWSLAEPQWHPYWDKRGINSETIGRYRLSYFREAVDGKEYEWVSIPIDDPDKGYIADCLRNVDPDANLRYKYTKGLVAEKHVWGLSYLPTWPQKVYVNEGIINALSMNQCGKLSLSTLGSGLSSFQIDILRRLPAQLVFMIEPDKAGLKYADKVMLAFPTAKIGLLPEDYKDPNEMLQATGTVEVQELTKLQWAGCDRRRRGPLVDLGPALSKSGDIKEE